MEEDVKEPTASQSIIWLLVKAMENAESLGLHKTKSSPDKCFQTLLSTSYYLSATIFSHFCSFIFSLFFSWIKKQEGWLLDVGMPHVSRLELAILVLYYCLFGSHLFRLRSTYIVECHFRDQNFPGLTGFPTSTSPNGEVEGQKIGNVEICFKVNFILANSSSMCDEIQVLIVCLFL